MSVSKVVRLEDVDRDIQGVVSRQNRNTFSSYEDRKEQAITEPHTSALQLVTSTAGKALSQTNGKGPNSVQDVDEAVLAESEAAETADMVYPLPDNWPKIPQLFRRRSCELTKVTSPCISKAISHLELLQIVIDDWTKEREEEVVSRMSQRQGSSRKELRLGGKEDSIFAASSRASRATEVSQELSVLGVGFIDESERGDGLRIPYLGAEEVVDEVITLMARLENDRQETVNALEREKERVITLGNKIDDISLQKLRDLPKAVELEHEACTVDLNELNWHVAYNKRNETRLTNRTGVAEVLNKRLKEDIAFVQNHIPLVDEKLDLEQEAMQKIRDAQKNTDHELNSTKVRKEKTEAKAAEAKNKAETERSHIKYELDQARGALNAISDELAEAKRTYNTYIYQINDIQQQLKDNEQELVVLDVKVENAKAAEEIQATKVREMQSKKSELEFEKQNLEIENANLADSFKLKKSVYEGKTTQYQNTIVRMLKEAKNASNVRKELEMDVQDLTDKIKECEQQKVKDEKNITRITREKIKLQQQMSVMMEDFNKTYNVNQTIREQLHFEQHKAFKTEESLKATAESFRKQAMDETHTKTILEARIKADSTEFDKARIDIREKRTKAQKVADEVTQAVSVVKTKVEKLRKTKEEKNIMKADLTEQIRETKKQQEESEKRFNERITQIQPNYDHHKDDLLKHVKRLDYIQWKSDVMNNQIGDMNKAQGMMDRLLNSAQNSIIELESEKNEITIQLQTVKRLEEDVRKQYDDLLQRIKTNESNHKQFMEDRNKVKQALEEKKKKDLQTNKDLASRYRTLQNEHMNFKDNLLNNFEEKVKLENDIKDCRQLHALQRKMHCAMLEYLKLRGVYNKSELNRMEEESSTNAVRISELQSEMDSALESITNFLQNQMGGENVRLVAMQSLRKKEAKAQKAAGLMTSLPQQTSHSPLPAAVQA
ncbi:hypothetical protein ACJMK2_041064 [Sinanodonta woodiana]|uniref:Coiled-coil domain-containing protein 178 n=1 Tax=Sinanodonta woodiana TaxID=1069815 RepID=A0ABD3W4R0_SINWO